MSELERGLRELGGELDYPATPPLAAAAARAVHAPARRHARGRPPLRALALAALLVALAAGAALAASPRLREELRELLGLRGATVERVAEPPLAAPSPPALGRRTTLAEARRRAGFRVLVPRRPDEVYLSERAEGGVVTLGFRARRGERPLRGTRLGTIVDQFRGDLEPDLVLKAAGPGTRVERLTVVGRRAIWIAGDAHSFLYAAPDGSPREAPPRLAASTLLLEHGPLLVRIEGEITLRRALAIARALR